MCVFARSSYLYAQNIFTHSRPTFARAAWFKLQTEMNLKRKTANSRISNKNQFQWICRTVAVAVHQPRSIPNRTQTNSFCSRTIACGFPCAKLSKLMLIMIYCTHNNRRSDHLASTHKFQIPFHWNNVSRCVCVNELVHLLTYNSPIGISLMRLHSVQHTHHLAEQS